MYETHVESLINFNHMNAGKNDDETLPIRLQLFTAKMVFCMSMAYHVSQLAFYTTSICQMHNWDLLISLHFLVNPIHFTSKYADIFNTGMYQIIVVY